MSLNYRLGPFGWLSLSQYGGVFADATNLGLQDIITALKWVQENIARFGGDPRNVTVTGHSAGAYSTIALLAAPAADGLYRRLAAFSGGASRKVPAWWAEELAIKFLTELGIADDPERLLTMDAKLLAETMIKVSPRDIGDRHGIDNTTSALWTTTLSPAASSPTRRCGSSQSGRHRDVDILFSTATNEADWWVINATEEFDPGSIDKMVDEFVRAKGVYPEAAPGASLPHTTSTDARRSRFAGHVHRLFLQPAGQSVQHWRTPRPAETHTCSPSVPSRARPRYTARRCTASSDRNALDPATSKTAATPSSATPSWTSLRGTSTDTGKP